MHPALQPPSSIVLKISAAPAEIRSRSSSPSPTMPCERFLNSSQIAMLKPASLGITTHSSALVDALSLF